MINDILILSNLTRGMEAKLRRIAFGWRQIDLASLAKVGNIEVTLLEKDRFVLPIKLNYMLYWLEMPLYVHSSANLERVTEYVMAKFGNEKEIYWKQREEACKRHLQPGF